MSDPAPIYPLKASADVTEFIEDVADITPSITYVYDLQLRRNVWINRSVYTHLGYDEVDIAGFGENILAELMHMEDLARYPEHYKRVQTLADGERAEFEYRMKTRDGSWRWLRSVEKVYRRNANGEVRQIIGAATDVTEAREREIEVAVTNRDMAHRVQNLFAVVTSMIRLTASSCTDPATALPALEARILAIAAAHEPFQDGSGTRYARFSTVAEQVLAGRAGARSVTITGDDPEIHMAQVTPLGLILNELAANAVDHGALGAQGGRIEIAAQDEGDKTVLIWQEHSADPQGEITDRGFGVQLMDASIGQLGGKIERAFTDAGLRVTLTMPNRITPKIARRKFDA